MKIVKKLLIILFLTLSCFLISCGKKEEESFHDYDEDIIKEYNGEVIPSFSIHTEKQNKYLTGDYTLASVYGKGQDELSKPQGIEVDFSSLVNDASTYEFYLDTSDEFSNPWVFNVSEKKITLTNLMIKTVYYYQVKYDNNKSVIKAFFVSDDRIRNLDIDGITNARDIGGVKINGKRINQGLIYRTSKFNDDEKTDVLITSDGINTLVNILKVKTEIDLRSDSDNEYGGITESPLGNQVNYIHISMESGGNCILLNKDDFKDLFRVLGNANNYPLVFHCSIGTDRTGMVSFLILNLLGASKEDIYYDYLFSNFGVIGRVRTPSIIDDYYKTIDGAQGDNYQEKTYNYLVSLGVNSSDLDNLINIMSK